jgi:phage-related protein
MKLSLLTWNSQNINNGTPFYATIEPGQLANIRVNPVLTNRQGDYPELSSVVKQGSVIVVRVRVAPGQSINTNREILKKYFFADEAKHNLVAQDEDDSNRQYYRSGIPVGLSEAQKAVNTFFVTIQTEYPYWQLVTAISDNWAVTGTADQQAITNIGNLTSKPIITITPTTTKTAGLTYRRYVPIYNNLDKACTATWDITSGGLNTAALVADVTVSNQINVGGGINSAVTTWAIDTAVGGGLPAGGGMFYVDTEQCTYTSITGGNTINGVTRGVNGTTAASHLDNAVMTRSKTQADGNDLRVYMDGTEANRWVYNPNSAATKVWVNVPLTPRKEGVLLTTVNAAATTIAFTQTAASLTFLQALKGVTNRTLLLENEAVVFNPDNINLIDYQITSVTRGQKETTAAGHTAGITIRHIEHDLWILYGDSSLAAPDTNDDLKPIFDLSSTNGAWTYTNYFDDGLTRPGSWRGEVHASRSRLSYTYTDDENAFADPSTVLGLAERNSMDFTTPNETAVLDWLFSHPAGITEVLYSGKKYRTGSWPAIIGLQYLQTGAVWFTIQNESTPTLATTWEAFGPITATLGGTYETIRFAIDGLLSSAVGESALIQFDTVTVTFASGNLPTIAVGSEAAINFFDTKITNNTTSEYIKFKTPCPLNSPLVIDTEAKKAYLADGRQVPVTLSVTPERTDWLNLASGANTLQWDDVGTVAVTVVVAHRDRNL